MLQSIKPEFLPVHRSVPAETVRAEEAMRTRDHLRTHLRAVVMLAGSVRTDALAQAARRSRAGLPLSVDENLLDHWVGHTRELASALNRPDLELRVLLSRGQAMPLPRNTENLRFSRIEDPDSFRGTGGLLHDVAALYGDDDLLLIVSGAQVLREPLGEIAIGLAQRKTVIALAVRSDGAPCDITLASARSLRTLRGNGYIDFKEQALPELARVHPIGILRCTGPLTFPIRNLSEYIRALRAHHGQRCDENLGDPYRDAGQSRFVIVEAGAEMGSGARAFDSVLLAGSRVDAGALLVRCVVGPGATVKAGARVIDELIGC